MGVAEILTGSRKIENGENKTVSQKIHQVLHDGATVYITSDAIHPEATLLAAYELEMADFDRLWDEYSHS